MSLPEVRYHMSPTVLPGVAKVGAAGFHVIVFLPSTDVCTSVRSDSRASCAAMIVARRASSIDTQPLPSQTEAVLLPSSDVSNHKSPLLKPPSGASGSVGE